MTCVNRMQHVAHTHNVLFNTVDNMAGERIVLVWILSLMSWTKGARVNIALRKTASTSLGNLDGWTADKAVDGNNNTNGESSTCFHGARGPSDWTVDLEYEYQLYDIKVYLRNGYNSRTADSIIYLDKNSSRVCYTFPSTISDNPTDVMCNGTAQHVTIKNPGNGPRHEDALNICEVEIYVCSNGSYGIDCTDSCGGCDDSSCDRWTGVCSGDCQAGYRGNKCDTMCSNGFYGIKCKEDCSNRKCYSNTGSCDAVSGSCDTGCRPGWIGTDCVKACRDQYYGSNCSSICEDRHCYGNSTCDHVTGSCDKGCDSGWKGTVCREQCDNEYYGRSCMMLCSSRHCEGNSSCDRITGQCVAGCQTGWAGSDCTETLSVENQAAVIAASVMAVIVIILLLVIGVILWRRSRPNTASQGAEVKDDVLEARTNQSLPMGHYDTVEDDVMSRDKDHTYTSIVHHADQPESVTQPVVTNGVDYEPVPGRI